MGEFKRWLIKKLGGYCEQQLVRPIVMPVEEPDIETVGTHIVLSYEDCMRCDVKSFVTKSIVRNIADSLLKTGALMIESEYDPIANQHHYYGTIKVAVNSHVVCD